MPVYLAGSPHLLAQLENASTASALAYCAGELYAASGRLARLTPRLDFLSVPEAGDNEISALACAGGRLLALDRAGRRILAYVPASLEPVSVLPLEFAPTGLATAASNALSPPRGLSLLCSAD